MTDFSNMNDILDFAINNEQEAIEFYTKLAEMAKSDDIKKTFYEFAGEEISHKAKLIDIKASGVINVSMEKVTDLKISDYMVVAKASADMSYQDALLLAMSKEKAAFKLYTVLSQRATSDDLKNLFLTLAIEESKHKLRFEIEYDENVLREN